MKALLLALLLFRGGGSVGPDPSFPKPTIHRVRVVGDTVWFEGTRGFDTVSTRYCFVRRAGTWCRLPRSASGAASFDDVPRSPGDSIAIAPGLTLVCRANESWRSACDTFGVLSSADRRVTWLIPHITGPTRAALLKAIQLETEEPPSMSSYVTAYAADERAVWVGLGGGFPEGEGEFGGLLRFDRQRETVETITHPGLANATVTGLVVDAGALWVGTVHPGEHGPWGSTGILRRDLGRGGWSTLDSATSALPDNLIQSLTAADGVLYVATRDGLAAFDVRTRRWNVRYFRRTIIADSIVYALAMARPVDEFADEFAFVLMQELRVRRRGAFLATMQQIGFGRGNPSVAREGFTPVSVLAHPALIPYLVEALPIPEAAALAASALAQIGDHEVVPALRAALSRVPANDAVWIAAALAQLGDSTGLTWLHGQLLSGRSSQARRYAMTALVRLRDTRSVEPIMTVLTNDADVDLRRFAATALGAYRSPALWRRMIDTARQLPELPPILVDAADSLALSDSAVARTVGEWALTLLGTASGGSHLYSAIRVAARLRPHDAVPAIIRLLAVDDRWADVAAYQLVRLTGIDSAPPVRPRGDDGRRLAREFWADWWRVNATRYQVVPREVGERAYRRWLDRVMAQERLERERHPGRRG